MLLGALTKINKRWAIVWLFFWVFFPFQGTKVLFWLCYISPTHLTGFTPPCLRSHLADLYTLGVLNTEEKTAKQQRSGEKISRLLFSMNTKISSFNGREIDFQVISAQGLSFPFPRHDWGHQAILSMRIPSKDPASIGHPPPQIPPKNNLV